MFYLEVESLFDDLHTWNLNIISHYLIGWGTISSSNNIYKPKYVLLWRSEIKMSKQCYQNKLKIFLMCADHAGTILLHTANWLRSSVTARLKDWFKKWTVNAEKRKPLTSATVDLQNSWGYFEVYQSLIMICLRL